MNMQDKIIRNILDSNLFGASAADMEGKLIYANSALLKLFRTTSENFIGKHASDFYYNPSDREQIVKLLTQHGFIEKINIKLKRDDSTTFLATLSFKKSIYVGENAYFCWFYDLTERIEMENELKNQININLHNSKLASIGELSADIAHEINNPLTIIKLVLKRLSKKIKDKSLHKYILEIENSILRMTNIVAGLGKYSRIDSQKVTKVDLIHVIRDTIDIFNQILISEGISLKLDMDDNDIYIASGIFGQIQQVLINILNNAKQALASSTKKEILISLYKDHGYNYISLKDTGTGIPEEILGQIFDPFFTTKTADEGTGIGLSMSYNLIKSFNGELTVSNNEKSGAQFIIKLPVTT